jgi:hypothetical protein
LTDKERFTEELAGIMKSLKRPLKIFKSITPTTPQRYVEDQVFGTDYKYICINAARGFGKTEVLKSIALKYILMGMDVLWLTNAFANGVKTFENLMGMLGGADGGVVELSNRQNCTAVLKNGGRLMIKSTHNDDILRGHHPGVIICDEIAFWGGSTFETIIKPMTLRNYDPDNPHFKGCRKVIMASTPNGADLGNIWYQIYKGLLTGREEYKNHLWLHFTWRSNAFVSEESMELERIAKPAPLFAQEYLAEFIDGNSSVFGEYGKHLYVHKLGEKQQASGSLYAAVDVAHSHDSTALCVMDSTGKVVFLRRYPPGENGDTDGVIDAILNDVSSCVTIDNPLSRLIVESNNQGRMFYDWLLKRARAMGHLNTGCFSPENSTLANKAERVHLFIRNLNEGIITIPDVKGLRDEFSFFRMKPSDSTAYPRYGAAAGKHDDMLMAIMWANKARVDGGAVYHGHDLVHTF